MEENGDKERESSPDSPQTDCDEEEDLIMISSKEDTPSSVRVIACLKRREDLKRFEETDECFILDFDPFEESPQQLSKLSLDHRNGEDADVGDDADADADVSLVAEKGPVACRDYPHSRHECLKFPFSKTPHESHCEMCYCYVCDVAAPCNYWTQPLAQHCNADYGYYWKEQRNIQKGGTAVVIHSL